MMPAKSRRPAILTIASNNYLHFVRTLFQSAKQYHPDFTLCCVIVGREAGYAAEFSSEFETILIDKLNLPLGEEFLFQYTILELNTAVKPWAIEYLLARGHDYVIYADPDIYFYNRMVVVDKILSADVDIVLTPHLVSPVTDDKIPGELDIRRAGTYNCGFCGVRNSANARTFLLWWQSKLTRFCIDKKELGLFVDQSWIDLVPGLFDNVVILRNKGYNVAYWNIAQRHLQEKEENQYFIGNEPLIFFHFSGLDLADPEAFSKYQNRFTLSTLGKAKKLVDYYMCALKANGHEKYQKLEYDFGCFSNGEKIPDILRTLYRSSSNLQKRMGIQPFKCLSVVMDIWPEISFEGLSPTNAMKALWDERRELQLSFPMNNLSSLQNYYRWFCVDPMVKVNYSSTVISHHMRLVESFDKEWMRSQYVVQCLYKYILDRAPDESGFLIYSERCKTFRGYISIWMQISLSKESKEKRRLLLRMLRALLFGIYTFGKIKSKKIE